MARKIIDLLIIDPQNDFCDPKGNLPVAGADDDMKRLATFINRAYKNFDEVHVTLDSHQAMDVAHPPFWKDSKGKSPDPFTTITNADIKSGKWLPFSQDKEIMDKMLAYTSALETGGRYPLMIWPIHCLIGSSGAAVYPPIMDALTKLAIETGSTIDYVIKGSNIWTEHYSAIRAEVPDPDDQQNTGLNTRLIQRLLECDEIAVAGEAGSHCVANTVRDIATAFGDDSYIKKIVLLEGCYSPVPTPDGIKMQADFLKEMIRRGMRNIKVADYLK